MVDNFRHVFQNSAMTKKQLLKLAGGARAAALLLGISTQAVAKWGKKVPDARIEQLHKLKPEWFK